MSYMHTHTHTQTKKEKKRKTKGKYLTKGMFKLEYKKTRRNS